MTVNLGRMLAITGERVSTAQGAFNPSLQRHRAEYRLCAPLLGPGPVLDLGCGMGHPYEELSPRRSVGVDVDEAALAGQARETHVADLRRLLFPDSSFDSVIAVHSIEPIPDPRRVPAEIRRVLASWGAILATPNRLTFDDAIDIMAICSRS